MKKSVFKALPKFQKNILRGMLLMIVVFAVLYLVRILMPRPIQYSFRDSSLAMSQEPDGSKVYTGKINHNDVRFTVSSDHAVLYQFGSHSYGPFMLRENSAVIPAEAEEDHLIGLELLFEDQVVFQCGYSQTSYVYLDQQLYPKLAKQAYRTVSDCPVIPRSDLRFDETGNPIDSNSTEHFENYTWTAPSLKDLIDLTDGLQPISPKPWWLSFECFLLGLFYCLCNVIHILHHRDLFRFQMGLSVRNPSGLEPSELTEINWELSWVLLPILAFVFFVAGYCLL
ncbi:MAG: hypothetical protein IIY94_02025 [Oscillospiraceae bacterium]|nr:hypothetical protein [Oscillospiraceae bacterium]